MAADQPLASLPWPAQLPARGAERPAFVIGQNASAMEQYAARELQRYLYQVSDSFLPIETAKPGGKLSGRVFLLGTRESNPLIAELADEGQVQISASDPGPQGYVLKKAGQASRLPSPAETLVIAGSDAVGCLYGVYGLLEDYYGIGFYLGGDVLPDKKTPLKLPDVDERKKPAVAIRGFLPWTNFPQSATSYSWQDWKFILDQMAKMRMNFLHIHNYNGEAGHNEMFHNVTLRRHHAARLDGDGPQRPCLGRAPGLGPEPIPLRRQRPVRRLRLRRGLRPPQREPLQRAGLPQRRVGVSEGHRLRAHARREDRPGAGY